MGKLFDHYHPERHYMRGPGPKWLEKQGGGLPAPIATVKRDRSQGVSGHRMINAGQELL